MPLPVVRDDPRLVEGLRTGDAWARAAFFDRCAPAVEIVLRRVLGHDFQSEIADLVHETFVQALRSVGSLRDPQALIAWMQAIAAHVAKRAIRARRARRLLRFWEPASRPEVTVTGVDPEVIDAYRRTYAVLERMPSDERVAFALRHIDGMDLARLAEVCEVSLATCKRRLSRAERRFVGAASRDPVLAGWLQEGGRWT